MGTRIHSFKYWILDNQRRERQAAQGNKRDIKLRHATIAQQRPQLQIPVRFTTNLPDQDPAPVDPSAVSARASKDAPYTIEQTSPASSHVACVAGGISRVRAFVGSGEVVKGLVKSPVEFPPAQIRGVFLILRSPVHANFGLSESTETSIKC